MTDGSNGKIVNLMGDRDSDFVKAIISTCTEILEVKAEVEGGGDPFETTIQEVDATFEQVLLKEGKTETDFWFEVVGFILSDGGAFDNYLAGKPLCEDLIVYK